MHTMYMYAMTLCKDRRIQFCENTEAIGCLDQCCDLAIVFAVGGGGGGGRGQMWITHSSEDRRLALWLCPLRYQKNAPMHDDVATGFHWFVNEASNVKNSSTSIKNAVTRFRNQYSVLPSILRHSTSKWSVDPGGTSGPADFFP